MVWPPGLVARGGGLTPRAGACRTWAGVLFSYIDRPWSVHISRLSPLSAASGVMSEYRHFGCFAQCFIRFSAGHEPQLCWSTLAGGSSVGLPEGVWDHRRSVICLFALPASSSPMSSASWFRPLSPSLFSLVHGSQTSLHTPQSLFGILSRLEGAPADDTAAHAAPATPGTSHHRLTFAPILRL